MSAQVSHSTLLYLFGDRMFPADPNARRKVRVPSGAELDATPLAVNALLAAVLKLRDEAIIEVTLTGEEPERREAKLGGISIGLSLGKPSRCVIVAREGQERPSVEGRILKRTTEDGVGQPVELRKAAATVLRQGDQNPWAKALELCRDEAKEAGLVEVKGLFRKTATADPTKLEPLEPAFEETVAWLKRAEAEEPNLVSAIWADCDNGLGDEQQAPPPSV